MSIFLFDIAPSAAILDPSDENLPLKKRITGQEHPRVSLGYKYNEENRAFFSWPIPSLEEVGLPTGTGRLKIHYTTPNLGIGNVAFVVKFGFIKEGDIIDEELINEVEIGPVAMPLSAAQEGSTTLDLIDIFDGLPTDMSMRFVMEIKRKSGISGDYEDTVELLKSSLSVDLPAPSGGLCEPNIGFEGLTPPLAFWEFNGNLEERANADYELHNHLALPNAWGLGFPQNRRCLNTNGRTDQPGNTLLRLLNSAFEGDFRITGNLTMSIMVNIEDDDTDGCYISCVGPSGDCLYYLAIKNTGRIEYFHEHGGNGADVYFNPKSYVHFGRWMHVVVTREEQGGTCIVRAYINGVKVDTSESLTSPDDIDDQVLWLGGWNGNTARTLGSQQWLMIDNRTYSDAEVSALYARYVCLDPVVEPLS